jgi:hypothetical protein
MLRFAAAADFACTFRLYASRRNCRRLLSPIDPPPIQLPPHAAMIIADVFATRLPPAAAAASAV